MRWPCAPRELVRSRSSTSGAGAADVASAIDRACREIGFFVIDGHGVPVELADAAWDAGHAFFALPVERRFEVAMPAVGYPYGYCPLSAETLASSLGASSPPDLKETYTIGPVDPPPRPLEAMSDADERAVYAPNLWPATVPSLRPAWEHYYRAMAELAGRLMDAFAAALGLPDGWFAPYIDRHGSAMRMVRYPHVDRVALPGQLRAGAHTDYGTSPSSGRTRLRAASRSRPPTAAGCRSRSSPAPTS